MLNQYKAAPIPASETDWQDLQSRLSVSQRTRNLPRRTTRWAAQAALGACVFLVAMAAGRFQQASAPVSPPSEAAKMPFQSKSDASQSKSAYGFWKRDESLLKRDDSLLKRDESFSKSHASFSKGNESFSKSADPLFIKKPSRTLNTKKLTVNRAKTRSLRAVSRRPLRRLAAHERESRRLKLAARTRTPKTRNVELTRIAADARAAQFVFFLFPVDDGLPTVQTAAPDAAPKTYVTAAIPAAPTPGTTENESEELQPW